MNLKDIVAELDIPHIDEILDKEFENLSKADGTIPYMPTPEFDILLDDVADRADHLNSDSKRNFKRLIESYIEEYDVERSMFSSDFTEFFDERDAKMKQHLSRLY